MNTKIKGSNNAARHIFAVGQDVKLKGRGKFCKAEVFLITGVLPPRGNSPQYRIQNHYENHERVITQDQIESAFALPIDIETTLVEKTFSKISVPERSRNANELGGLL